MRSKIQNEEKSENGVEQNNIEMNTPERTDDHELPDIPPMLDVQDDDCFATEEPISIEEETNVASQNSENNIHSEPLVVQDQAKKSGFLFVSEPAQSSASLPTHSSASVTAQSSAIESTSTHSSASEPAQASASLPTHSSVSEPTHYIAGLSTHSSASLPAHSSASEPAHSVHNLSQQSDSSPQKLVIASPKKQTLKKQRRDPDFFAL